MNSSLYNQKVAFIGAGALAEALISGMVEKHIADPNKIYVTNRGDRAKLEKIRQRYGVQIALEPETKERFIREADLIVIAMKPKDVAEALTPLRPLFSESQLLVSVIAGLSIETLETMLPGGMPIVRTMPNTSSSIGLGMTGLSFSNLVSDQQRHIATEMFQAIGQVAVIPDKQMDTLTGISGSGPAYVYYFMEAMIEAAIENGFDPDTAYKLTAETVLGAATMVKRTGEFPAELRRKVTSPNGTTQAAIEMFDQYEFPFAIKAAIRRCIERAGEIGQQLNEDASQANRNRS